MCKNFTKYPKVSVLKAIKSIKTSIEELKSELNFKTFTNG